MKVVGGETRRAWQCARGLIGFAYFRRCNYVAARARARSRIRAYFIPIRVKRVAGDEETERTLPCTHNYVKLIWAPLAVGRGTNDFPQRRTRSNEAASLSLVTTYTIYILVYIYIYIYVYFCPDSARNSAFPRNTRRAWKELMEILNRASTSLSYDSHRDIHKVLYYYRLWDSSLQSRTQEYAIISIKGP